MFQEFDHATTTSTFWESRVTKSHSKLALHSGQAHLTWRELDQQLAIIVQNFAQAGITTNSVIALLGKLNIEQCLIYLACLKSGRFCAVLNDDDSSEDLQHKITTLKCEFVVASIEDSTSTLGKPVIDLQRLMKGTHFQSTHQISKTIQTILTPIESNEMLPMASIVFTSGTTAKPKAVVHSVYNHLVSAAGVCEEMQLSERDNWMLSLPLYHVSGIAIIWRWLACGGQITIPLQRQRQIEDINFPRVTVISWVSTQLQSYLASDGINNRLKVLLGGSHFSDSLISHCRDIGVTAWLGYGFTEAASTVCAKRLDSKQTVGHCLAHRTVKVENKEVCVKGDVLALGYLVDGIIVDLPLKQGFFNTSDLGEWEGTQLKIIGRKGNMFISGGENIHCEEVESAIKRINGVKDVLVIPIDDEKFGKVGVAMIECDELHATTHYRDALSNTLARFKHPKYFIKLPHNMGSKGIKLPRYEITLWLEDNLERLKNGRV